MPSPTVRILALSGLSVGVEVAVRPVFMLLGPGRLHLAAAVAALVVVAVDELHYLAAGLGFGGEMPA